MLRHLFKAEISIPLWFYTACLLLVPILLALNGEWLAFGIVAAGAVGAVIWVEVENRRARHKEGTEC